MPHWLTRPVVAWSLYDLASSTYIAVVPTFFGVYFVTVVAGGSADAQGTWGVITAIALVVSGALAPFVGAWADRHGRWFAAIAATTALCVAATSLMGGGLGLAAVATAFVAAQVGYTLAVATYDSLLVRVAPPTHAGRVSGFGWALGFVGGIASLVVAAALMHGTREDAQAARLPVVFVASGILFALIALPALASLRGIDGAAPGGARTRASARDVLASVARTLRGWRRDRNVFRFLLAYYLFNDVLVTLLFFIAIVAKSRYGIEVEGLIWLALLYHLIALPATVAFGHAADRWGARPVIFAMVAILAATLLLLALGSATRTVVVVTVLLGLVYGSLQAVCRTLLALLVEPARAAEIFGFNALAGRLSAALGPLLFGAVVTSTGSSAAALLSLLPFLAAGAYLLAGVRVPDPRVATGAEAPEPGQRGAAPASGSRGGSTYGS